MDGDVQDLPLWLLETTATTLQTIKQELFDMIREIMEVIVKNGLRWRRTQNLNM